MPDPLARQFYTETCRSSRWRVRTLRERVPGGCASSGHHFPAAGHCDEDFCLDLLFCHRRLAKPGAIDLKLGRFEAGYKGEMEFYLRWLDQYGWRTGQEEAPMGLIQCSGTNQEQVELPQLIQRQTRAAEYLTALPSKSVYNAKRHEAVIRVRERMARCEIQD